MFTMTTSTGRGRAIDETLAPAREELLAELVASLSEHRGAAAVTVLDELTAAHPDLAGQLRELFAAMSVADAVADESTILAAGSDWQTASAPPQGPQSGFVHHRARRTSCPRSSPHVPTHP